MLSNLLCESEEFIKEPENAMTDKVHHDELNLLHEICDGDIALHSVELAIKVCYDLTYQSQVQVLRLPRREIIVDEQTLLPSEINNKDNISDLERAIAMQRRAVASTPRDSTHRPAILMNLGNTYWFRFDQSGERKDIDSAIEQQLKAAASVPLNSVDRPTILRNLGSSYLSRFERFGDIQDLESAIKHQLEVVASIPLNNPNRPVILNDLGASYQLRFKRFGKKEDIDLAIKQQLEAVASTPPDNPNRAGYLNNLGNSYCSRFTHFGEVNDIDSAINQQIEAVASIALDSSKRPECLSRLGVSYGNRFLRSGEVKDIDLSIKHQLEAVASTPLKSVKRAGPLNNLGMSYKYRFKHFGEMKDNDLSIKLLLEALSSIPLDNPDRLVIVNYLGSSYADRFNFSGDMKDIDLAIEKHLEVVASVPIDSPHRSHFLDQLGRSSFARFERFGKKEDIDFAIEQGLEAVASASPADRSGFINNLGYLYLRHFQRFRGEKDIDSAIEKLVEAVATTPLDSPGRPRSLYHLGLSYSYRFESNQEPTDLEESISNYRLSSLSLKGLPSVRIRGSLQWALLAHNRDNLESASEAYDQAFRLLPQVAWIGLNARAQLKELNSSIQMLGCNAAACMISLAQAEHHNRQRHLGRAIELLDQGRSILWSQTSNFKQDLEDLQEVDSDIASDLDNVGKFLAQGCFRDPNDPLSETETQLYRRYAERWEELVYRIRGLPGFHHFLLPLPISTLQTAAAEGPVVIINSSKYRCDAVIVPSQGDLVLIPLPDTSAAELESLANQQEGFASRKSKSVWIPSKDYSMPSETLEKV
jgi:tetratricopeptide (TPR) repeat protein